jgi:hypothetical protein
MESKVGYILALIGGIITVIGGLWWLIAAGALTAFYASLGFGWMGSFGIAGGILYLVFGIISIIAAVMINNPKKVKTGGILALIFGILSGFNILTIIGGILGLVAGSK